MNMRIALGAALVFALGSAAVGSTSMNAQSTADAAVGSQSASPLPSAEVTPDVLAMLKATTTSSDYTPPRLPI